MTLDFITEVITNILLLPLQLVLIPIDAFLAQIPGIASIPSTIRLIGGFIGNIPSTLVSLFGIQPFLWNATFLVFVLFITISPGINGIKKIWAWVRP